MQKEEKHEGEKIKQEEGETKQGEGKQRGEGDSERKGEETTQMKGETKQEQKKAKDSGESDQKTEGPKLNTETRKPEVLVELRNITKYYGDRLAVDNISFSVGKGEILGFLGPNGAGKTTTMRIITGYMPPTSGEVKVCGVDVLDNPIEAKKHIGYLPENPPLYHEMTVISYLKFVASIKKIPRNRVKERLDYVISKCGLEEVKGRVIGNLSRGYKQRVGIAQAIINDPDVMIFDEPTVGLDPKQVVEIRGLIKEISKEKAVILSTHILSEVMKICDRVIIISSGRLVFSAYLDEIQEVSGERIFVLTLKNKDDSQSAISLLQGIDGVHRVSPRNGHIEIRAMRDIRERVADTLFQKGIVFKELYEERPSLEDVYLKVVAG